MQPPEFMTPRPLPRRARLVLGLLWLVLSLFAAPLAARDVTDLFSARVPVADRSPTQLARGASAALSQVLVKLVGTRQGAANPALQPVRAQASRLMLQYAFEPTPDGQGLLLRAEFDEPALAAELSRRGIATWGRQRPDTLTWLVIDTGTERVLVSAEDPGRLGGALLARASARGLPVLLPLLDIQESQALLAAADWNAIAAAATTLSARYGAPGVLITYLRQSAPGLWEANWKVQVDADDFASGQEGDLPELIVEESVDALADALAHRYADPTMLAGAEKLVLTVSGVNTAADYARLSTYLAALDTVSGLFLHGVGTDGLRYEMTARGGRAAFAQSIGFGRVLAPVAGQPDHFRLLP